jgi:multidrug resistance efflux pump
MKYFPITVVAALAALTPWAGCSRERGGSPEGASATRPTDPAPTNRVDVPPPVRQNLGITFARVERRPVARTIRVPGRFELLPDARREYRAAFEGRVDLLVKQFDEVEPSTVLCRLDSPKWRDHQQALAAAEAAILLARASTETIGPLRAAHKVHEQSLAETVKLWSERVTQLERLREAGGGRADELAQARITLTSTQADLADVMEKDAELEARNRQVAAELDVARARFDILLGGAASLLGTTVDELRGPSSSATNAPPLWRTIAAVDVRATAPGVVDAVAATNGAWVDQSELVLSTVQPRRLRLRAHGLQSDLMSFRHGADAVIAPPRQGGVELQDVMRGPLVLGPGGNPADRTVALFVTPEQLSPWARAGVTAYLEVVASGGSEALAIPRSAVVRDGLKSILFRRDPKDPDKVIRLDADLGIDDGRWIAIRSGVAEGDEVVVDGIYQLMLATSGSAPRGGHFHADGTFHEGGHK